MPKCPITYEICEKHSYSPKGLKQLHRKLDTLTPFPYTVDEQLHEAASRSAKMSIQGVQPKLSAILNLNINSFEVVNQGGQFILKPQNPQFPQLPENEDLSMKLAQLVGIEVPIHGLIWTKDLSLTYFIKRFDRAGKTNKLSVEDFAQLAGESRDTKYNYSMERLIPILDQYCTFPALEKAKLLKRVLFNFLIGNEDMHLKNYSLITRQGKTELAPAYDFVNTTIAIKQPIEEIALPINGKKRKINRHLLINYYAKDRLQLSDKMITQILEQINTALPHFYDLIAKSFLSESLKTAYVNLLDIRKKILGSIIL